MNIKQLKYRFEILIQMRKSWCTADIWNMMSNGSSEGSSLEIWVKMAYMHLKRYNSMSKFP